MQTSREIDALLNLIDDPDEEVFMTVEQRLMTYGSPLIPQLENLWENTISEDVQHRIEMIIHRIHFGNLKEEFVNWCKDDGDLLHGAMLVAKYQYPELQTMKVLQETEKMRRNLWLEMNNFVTPIEQAKIFESILYNYYKMRGGEIQYNTTDDFMIHKAIERKKGNAIIAGIIYAHLSQLLDIPVKVIRIPRQFVLGYFSQEALFNQSFEEGKAADKIKFFIDPNSGTAFSHKDIDQYFKRIGVNPVNSYFKPLGHKQIIQVLVNEFAKCFNHPDTLYKQTELAELNELLTLQR